MSLQLPDRPVLTVKEVATLLQVNVKTLYAAIESGSIPAIRVGKTIRVPTNAVASLLQRGQVGAQGESRVSKTRT
jgi:excisionase family DNA binding protein